jgi:hypothetical protein
MIVTGNAQSGQPILFRIGLKSEYTPTEIRPARYAMVLLSYNNNAKHHLIYLRQGHDADYLFSNGDGVASGSTISSRTLAKRFSPYNLTAATLNAAANISGSSLTGNPGKFTDFPSQTGAFFQWANTAANETFLRMRWAWDPYRATIPTTPNTGSWQPGKPASNVYWNTLATDHEACPDGYRRPNDGVITGNSAGTASTSELRQSLFHKLQNNFNYTPDLTNCVWGLYADGFFDRRPISGGISVATGTRDVAYIGRLLYNLHPGADRYGASVFFPTGGTRYATTGDLGTTVGSESSYWTSSAVTNVSNDGISLRMINTDHTRPWLEDKSTGNMIRCVKKDN